MDALGRYVCFDTIFTGEAMDMFTGWVPTDDRRTHDELGVAWRDPTETIEACIRALVDTGRVTAAQAGRSACERRAQAWRTVAPRSRRPGSITRA